MFVRFLFHPSRLIQFGVFDGENLMGLVECQLTASNQTHWAVVKNLVIYEPFRRRGAATYLLTSVIECLANPVENFGQEIPLPEKLIAIVPRNPAAIGLFKKCGFTWSHRADINVGYQYIYRRTNVIVSVH